MLIEDIEFKKDNPIKKKYLLDKQIPSNETISMDEFNCIVEEIKELKSKSCSIVDAEGYDLKLID